MSSCAAAGRWAQAAQLLAEGRSMALEPTATLGAKGPGDWHRQAKLRRLTDYEQPPNCLRVSGSTGLGEGEYVSSTKQ